MLQVGLRPDTMMIAPDTHTHTHAYRPPLSHSTTTTSEQWTTAVFRPPPPIDQSHPRHVPAVPSSPSPPPPAARQPPPEPSPRIRLRNLSHVVDIAKEDYAAASPYDDTRRYEISAMPVTDVIEMVASLLTKITSTNDAQHRAVPPEDAAGAVLAFHGKNVPSITILSYLSRIHKYCPTTYEVFLSLLVYFDRMAEEVVADGQSQGIFVVDSYNIHRLVIAGVTCASKFFSDVFYTNSRYAKVGGLPLPELNHLELQFLILNDFRLAVPVEELEAYGTMLVQFYARETIARAQAEVESAGTTAA